MSKANRFCQSCAMPMKQDPKQGGTEADGTRSEEYCSYCYVEGEFTQTDLNAEQMQAFCVEKMQEQGMPKLVAWLFTRNIPKLRRWKNA